MSNVRVAAFNLENLFRPYTFQRNVNPETAIRDGRHVNQLNDGGL